MPREYLKVTRAMKGYAGGMKYGSATAASAVQFYRRLQRLRFDALIRDGYHHTQACEYYSLAGTGYIM